MGKKIKMVSDPNLAKLHKAGAVVELSQPVLHSQFGSIHYLVQEMYIYHFERAEKAFQNLERYQKEILALPIKSNNVRMIADYELLRKMYMMGFDMVTHIYLGFDHFLMSVLMHVYSGNSQRMKIWNKREMLGRASHVIGSIYAKKELLKTCEYTGLVEIEQKRHAFNHPNARRICNANKGEWDEVPLAWIISGKYRDPYIKTMALFEKLCTFWEKEEKKYNRPGKLISVQRGMKSLHQIKKNISIENTKKYRFDE